MHFPSGVSNAGTYEKTWDKETLGQNSDHSYLRPVLLHYYNKIAFIFKLHCHIELLAAINEITVCNVIVNTIDCWWIDCLIDDWLNHWLIDLYCSW